MWSVILLGLKFEPYYFWGVGVRLKISSNEHPKCPPPDHDLMCMVSLLSDSYQNKVNEPRIIFLSV